MGIVYSYYIPIKKIINNIYNSYNTNDNITSYTLEDEEDYLVFGGLYVMIDNNKEQ